MTIVVYSLSKLRTIKEFKTKLIFRIDSWNREKSSFVQEWTTEMSKLIWDWEQENVTTRSQSYKAQNIVKLKKKNTFLSQAWLFSDRKILQLLQTHQLNMAIYYVSFIGLCQEKLSFSCKHSFSCSVTFCTNVTIVDQSLEGFRGWVS